jgi:hypothetical protein
MILMDRISLSIKQLSFYSRERLSNMPRQPLILIQIRITKGHSKLGHSKSLEEPMPCDLLPPIHKFNWQRCRTTYHQSESFQFLFDFIGLLIEAIILIVLNELAVDGGDSHEHGVVFTVCFV